MERVREFLKNYDFSLLIGMIIFSTLGVLAIYSSTHMSTDPRLLHIYRSQIIWATLAISTAFIVSVLKPKLIFKLAYPAYFINLFLLVLVFFLGKKGMGAQRWLVLGSLRVQPSEFMKISLVLALAKWFCSRHEDEEISLKDLVIPGLMLALPMFFILKQPDLGTALILLIISCFVFFYKKLRMKDILILICLGLIGGGLTYKFALKPYQKQRVKTFMDPYADAQGTGYNAIQSAIAIGSGRISGKGYMKSTQASLAFLPENHTDFIFSVLSEEHGFLGAMGLLSLYFIFMMRLLWIGMNTLKVFDSIVIMGLLSFFFVHIFVNIGMVMGIMPIVGLPLPFISYGGSSILTFGMAIGLMTSISNHRNWGS